MCAPRLSSSLCPSNDLSARGFSKRGPGPTRPSSVWRTCGPSRRVCGPPSSRSSCPLVSAPAYKRPQRLHAARRAGTRPPRHDHVRWPGRRPQRGPRSGGQRPPDFLAGRKICGIGPVHWTGNGNYGGQTALLRIAIVGLGPWGVCALERVVTTARQELPPAVDVAVHVIEPGTPGSGVYDVTQPDYLLLNNPCGELSLYPFETESDQPYYGVGLYEWAVERGYRWVGDRCVIDRMGQPIEPHHFLPRRLMGEYLQWFYRALVASAPPGVHIVHHPTAAVDLIARRNGTRGGAAGQRRVGRRRPRDRHLRSYREPAGRSCWTRDRPVSGQVLRRHNPGRRDRRRLGDGIGGGRRGDGADRRAGRRVRREWCRRASLPA